MRTPITFSILVAVLAVALAARSDQQGAAPGPPAAPATGTGLIIGQVVDAGSGKGVGGAFVTLAGSAPLQLQQRVLADDDGGFVFTSLPKGGYSLTATTPGYVNGAYRMKKPGGKAATLDLADGDRVLDASITLWRYGVIAGTVLDDADDPVVGVRVSVLQRSVMWGEPHFSPQQATTDDRGVYRAGSLPPGEYLVGIFSTTTTLPASVMSAFQLGPQNRDLQSAILAATSAFSAPGSPDNRRIGDLIVQDTSRSLVTRDSGASGTLAVFPTTFYPEASSPALASMVAVGAGETRAGIDLHLHPLATRRVTGTLTGPSGPVPTMALRLIPQFASVLLANSGAETASTLTDASGKFTFLGVPPGDYMLRAMKTPANLVAPVLAPILWGAQPVSVADSDVSVAVEIHPGLTVSGRLQFDGSKDKPSGDQLSRVGAVMQPVGEGPSLFANSHPDSTGSFTTYGVPAGRYTLSLSSLPAGWMVKSAMLDGKDIIDLLVELTSDVSDLVVVLTDRLSQVSGAVVTGRGAPGLDAAVLMFPTDPKMWRGTPIRPRRLVDVRVSPSGAYTFANLPAGDYFIAAVDDASVPSEWRDPKVLESLSHVAIRIKLEEGQSLSQHLQMVVIK